MEANLNSVLGDLKLLIQQLSVSDRWLLLKWLVELLQQEPQSDQKEKTTIDLSAVHQICDEIRSLPVLDSRSSDEIIGYNQFGGLD
ncbi:MAG: hypothetical protein F6J92_24360 [Symploca sp. SIO1A3]|nr:hypothetical protein [Symploca sp. SIO1A3]